MALVTAAQVREVTTIDSSNDTALGVLIARADAAFARFCGHPKPDSGAHTMEAATYTRYPDRFAIGVDEERHVCTLDTPTIQSVTSVNIDPEQAHGASTLLASSEYVASGRSIELLLAATTGWSTAARANKVVVSAGYTPADHPVLQQACIEQVVHWYTNTRHAGSESVSAGQGSRRVNPGDLLPEVEDMLGDYVLAVP